MNEDDFEKDLVELTEISEKISESVPEALKSILESPGFEQMRELSVKIQQTMPAAAVAMSEKLGEVMQPYEQFIQNFSQNILPALYSIAKGSSKLSIIYLLGEAEYVTWKTMPDSFFERTRMIHDSYVLLDAVNDWLADEDYKSVDETLDILNQNELLGSHQLFHQSVNAYRNGFYDIAVLGLTALTDKLLSEYTGQTKIVNIKQRVQALNARIEKGGNVELDDLDLNQYALITTYTKALELFGMRSEFTGDEPDLNRHWIMHGRMERPMKRIDCIRIINILNGTILMKKLGDDLDDTTNTIETIHEEN